jgi:hypothetical protein
MFTSHLKRNDANRGKTLSTWLADGAFSLRMSFRLWMDSLLSGFFGPDRTVALDDQLETHGYPPLRILGRIVGGAHHRAARLPKMTALSPAHVTPDIQRHGARPEAD